MSDPEVKLSSTSESCSSSGFQSLSSSSFCCFTESSSARPALAGGAFSAFFAFLLGLEKLKKVKRKINVRQRLSKIEITLQWSLFCCSLYFFFALQLLMSSFFQPLLCLEWHFLMHEACLLFQNQVWQLMKKYHILNNQQSF